MSLRGKDKVKNELGFAFMAVNLRKYTAKDGKLLLKIENKQTKSVSEQFILFRDIFYTFWLVMSQPLFTHTLFL